MIINLVKLILLCYILEFIQNFLAEFSCFFG
jgi:hypothetical protein